MSELCAKLDEIEAEMRRIAFWSVSPAHMADDKQLYSNLPFEQWLQFVYLPQVRVACGSGDFSAVPQYRVGLAAMRNYDYHSTVEEALPLVQLCHELEALLQLAQKGPNQSFHRTASGGR